MTPQYNYITFAFTFPPWSPPYIPSCYLSNFFIDCCYGHICVFIPIYIPKYNLILLYNITCMYTFRADHLVLGHGSLCFSLDKTFGDCVINHIYPHNYLEEEENTTQFPSWVVSIEQVHV